MPGRPRLIAAEVTARERRTVRAVAHRDGLTVANFIRRCVNAALLDSGDPLLAERVAHPGRPRVFTTADIRRMKALRASGCTYRQIADRLGVPCAYGLVRKWVVKDA